MVVTAAEARCPEFRGRLPFDSRPRRICFTRVKQVCLVWRRIFRRTDTHTHTHTHTSSDDDDARARRSTAAQAKLIDDPTTHNPRDPLDPWRLHTHPITRGVNPVRPGSGSANWPLSGMLDPPTPLSQQHDIPRPRCCLAYMCVCCCSVSFSLSRPLEKTGHDGHRHHRHLQNQLSSSDQRQISPGSSRRRSRRGGAMQAAEPSPGLLLPGTTMAAPPLLAAAPPPPPPLPMMMAMLDDHGDMGASDMVRTVHMCSIDPRASSINKG
jgi:hypothetical protein